MAKFGQCSDSSCGQITVRLFECTHHCQKMVCLQHLVKHDEVLEKHQCELENLRAELRQLWSTYSSLIDETKLRHEYEHKLKQHQQLMEKINHVLTKDPIDMEQYRLVLKKLKENINEENDVLSESYDSLSNEEQIKEEPVEEALTTKELNESPDISESSLNNDSSFSNRSDDDGDDEADSSTINENRPLKKISGMCPFWLDGAFGLSKKLHGMYLCKEEKCRQNLYNHLLKCHKLLRTCAKKICVAIQNGDDPLEKILFKPNEIVIDRVNQFHCPFSIHHQGDSPIDKSSQHPCRLVKPLFAHALRYHFIRTHQMTACTAKKIWILIENSLTQTSEND